MGKKTKNRMKLLSIVTTSMILLSVVFSYGKFNDFIKMKGVYEDAKQIVISSSELFIESILSENKKSSLDKLSIYAENIQKKLFETYGDELEGLKYDIMYPSENSKLTKVLNEVIGNSYINSDNGGNGIFVMTRDNVIWDKRTTELLPMKVEEVYNTKIDASVMNGIISRTFSEDNIIVRTTTGDDTQKNLLTDINSAIIEGKLNSLKGYELLIPVYITDTGDIFGVDDNSGISPMDNFKIILVQRVNVYDALSKYNEQSLFIEKELNSIENSVDKLAMDEMQWMIFSLGYVIFIIIITRIIQSIVVNNNER